MEYEQKGNDRAVYGDRLLKRLVESIDVRGINETLLKNCRRFYVLYPQIKYFLTREKSPTISDFSEFESSAIDIVANLSFSHIVEIMTVEDSLARFFYETECVKCCWSVKELRRQISTNLCNVLIELKNNEFKHSDLSQLNAYVSYFKRKRNDLIQNNWRNF